MKLITALILLILSSCQRNECSKPIKVIRYDTLYMGCDTFYNAQIVIWDTINIKVNK